MNKQLILLLTLAPTVGLASSSSSSSISDGVQLKNAHLQAPKYARFLLDGKPGVALPYTTDNAPPSIDTARLLMAMARPGKKSFADRIQPLLAQAEQRNEPQQGSIFTQAITDKILPYLTYRDLCKIFPVSKRIASSMANPHVIMPTGAAWVDWATHLLNSDQSSETIFNTIISACGRSPNAREALSTIKFCYMANVPDQLRLFDLNGQGALRARENERNKRNELLQLFDRLSKDPTCVADQQQHAQLLGELLPKLKISLPYQMASLMAGGSPEGIFPCLTARNNKGCEQWLISRCGPSFVYEFCLFGRLFYSCLPAMHQCLANVPANAASKAKIEEAITSITYGFPRALEPCTLTCKAEDEVIKHLEKIIWTMRQISKGNLLKNHGISKEKLLAVRKQAEKELDRFLSDRQLAMPDRLAPKYGNSRSLYFARRAELFAKRMERGFLMISEAAAHYNVAHDFVMASNSGGISKKNSGTYFMKALGHARRALTLSKGQAEEQFIRWSIEKDLKGKALKYGSETQAGKALRAFMNEFNIRDLTPVAPVMSDDAAKEDAIIEVADDDSVIELSSDDMVDEAPRVVMMDDEAKK